MKPTDMIELAQRLAQMTPRLNDHGDITDVTTAAAAAARAADRIGLLRIVLKRTQDELETVRAELEDTGLKAIEGDFYRVSFASCDGATKVNWKAVAAKLKPSHQLIAAHTTVGKESVRMDVTALKTH
jgi:hypothetical protein